MAIFHKIQKHFVSKIDFFIKKESQKPLTKSQQANKDRCDKIAKMRDEKIKTQEEKKSIWD